jgi:hypothetical protein
MRLVLINVIMAIASFFIMAFSYWTYNQSLFNNKIKTYLQTKPVTSISNLKTIAALTDRLVLVKGEIVADETFTGKKGKKVVLERFQEETKDKNSNKDWKEVTESRFFKFNPFWLKEKSKGESSGGEISSPKVLIDGYGLDKTYLGTPEINDLKTENEVNILKRTKYWSLSPGQTAIVLGNVENKGGQLIINSPNLYISDFNPFAKKEPFIITSFSESEITEKALGISKSLYYTSLALLAIGVFFLLSSLNNILKNYQKLKSEND